MRTTIDPLRAFIAEALVSAGADYMRKERVREALQAMIIGMVKDSRIADQAGLDEAFLALDMSVKALKMVPFEAWQGLAGASGAAKPGTAASKKKRG